MTPEELKSLIETEKLSHDVKRMIAISELPLIAFDLIIRNSDGKILLGWRINEPAKDTWFVPGGSIDKKDDDLNKAFERICKKELGLIIQRSDACFIGLFEHDYDTNYQNVKGIGTKYKVLAYEIRGLSSIDLNELPSFEHKRYKWFSQEEADERNSMVHSYVKGYYNASTYDKIIENQYAVLNERRDSYNSLIWQTPVISLTAQAFLFLIILTQDITDLARMIAAGLAFITALASIQLSIKHRFYEKNYAILLQKLEAEQGFIQINKKQVHKCSWNPWTWMIKIRSHIVWNSIFLIFALAALAIIIINIIRPDLIN